MPARVFELKTIVASEACQPRFNSDSTPLAYRVGYECRGYKTRLHHREKLVESIIDKDTDDRVRYCLFVFLYKLLGDSVWKEKSNDLRR